MDTRTCDVFHLRTFERSELEEDRGDKNKGSSNQPEADFFFFNLP